MNRKYYKNLHFNEKTKNAIITSEEAHHDEFNIKSVPVFGPDMLHGLHNKDIMYKFTPQQKRRKNIQEYEERELVFKEDGEEYA